MKVENIGKPQKRANKAKKDKGLKVENGHATKANKRYRKPQHQPCQPPKGAYLLAMVGIARKVAEREKPPEAPVGPVKFDDAWRIPRRVAGIRGEDEGDG